MDKRNNFSFGTDWICMNFTYVEFWHWDISFKVDIIEHKSYVDTQHVECLVKVYFILI